ncbi:MAG TPA: MarR family winged helix-turn-helix transcriptional regulator [Cyclobacteriaceae bacterium]|jgi:DNA-binding MarR family transcriptional regulator|nr:MarR family winged helix-turn-helix transcriptional regulator [Cyclobacteriaceae bacterium]
MKNKDIQLVREFNRFYTGIIGLLDEHIFQSPYSLPEARVLYELHHQQPCSATELVQIIGMDKGYLSRVVNGFEKKGLITRRRSKKDARSTSMALTSKGEKEFALIDQASAAQLTNLLSFLSPSKMKDLLVHMTEIKKLLTKRN